MTEPKRKPYFPAGYTKPQPAGDRLRTMTGVVIGGAVERTPAHTGAEASNAERFDEDLPRPGGMAAVLAGLAGLGGIALIAAVVLLLTGMAAYHLYTGMQFSAENGVDLGAGLGEFVRFITDNPLVSIVVAAACLIAALIFATGSAIGDVLTHTQTESHQEGEEQ